MSAEVRSPANFVEYLPPPTHPPSAAHRVRSLRFPRIDSRDAAAGGQNLLMPLHRTILAWVFFLSKLVRSGTHDVSKKKHCRRFAPIIFPSPSPNDHMKARVGGSRCSPYFCSACEIKKSSRTDIISPYPALRPRSPNLIILSTPCPRAPSPNDHTTARVGPVLSQGSWCCAALPIFSAHVR